MRTKEQIRLRAERLMNLGVVIEHKKYNYFYNLLNDAMNDLYISDEAAHEEMIRRFFMSLGMEY